MLILTAMIMPGKAVPDVGMPGIDKLVHFGMFGVLTLCFYFEYSRNRAKLPHFIYTLLAIVVFGFLTEVMQLFADARSFDLKDLAADTIGILAASSLFNGFKKYIIKC